MKNAILLFYFFAITTSAQAQTTEDSVKNTINRFFEGMKKNDTTVVRSTMTDGVIFQSVAQTKEGKTTVRTEKVNDFLAQIAKPMKEGVLDERITFDVVRVDGGLASVWTPYKFYLGDKFLHCGANSFQLVRLDGQWLIQYIVDTRRRQGCD